MVNTVTTMKINIRKARENFSEVINRVTAKGERVILTSRNKPKAAIVSLKDAMAIEDRSMRKAKRLLQLERIKKMRQKLARKRLMDDSLETLRKIREERIEVRSSGG
jgi:prevent-host-death family protein